MKNANEMAVVTNKDHMLYAVEKVVRYKEFLGGPPICFRGPADMLCVTLLIYGNQYNCNSFDDLCKL